MQKAASLSAFLEASERAGKLNLRTEDLRAALPHMGPEALRQALDRQRRRGRVARLSRGSGHWLIVPLQHAAAGAPPPEVWLDRYLGRTLALTYYVAMMSAAELYGVAPYGIMVTQVMVAERRRPIRVGRHRIVFHTRTHIERMPTRWHETPDGKFRISSPDVTAVDLVQRQAAAGGMARVREVLRGLWPLCTPAGLIQALDAADNIRTTQRLGALLALDGQTPLAATVATWLTGKPMKLLSLEGSPQTSAASRIDPIFKVRIPERLEDAGT